MGTNLNRKRTWQRPGPSGSATSRGGADDRIGPSGRAQPRHASVGSAHAGITGSHDRLPDHRSPAASERGRIGGGSISDPGTRSETAVEALTSPGPSAFWRHTRGLVGLEAERLPKGRPRLYDLSSSTESRSTGSPPHGESGGGGPRPWPGTRCSGQWYSCWGG